MVESSRKQLKKIKKNQYATLQLSKYNERNESIKNRSSYICTDPPGCSVREVLDQLATLLGCGRMTPLFKLGISLFRNRANREIFVALKDPKYQIE